MDAVLCQIDPPETAGRVREQAGSNHLMQGVWFGVWVWGVGCGVWGVGCGVLRLGFRVLALGFGVRGIGFRV